MEYIVGVDIGGTFTDCVVIDPDGGITVGKALSTPSDFSAGALDAVRDAARNLGLRDETSFFARQNSSFTPAPSATIRSSLAPVRKPA